MINRDEILSKLHEDIKSINSTQNLQVIKSKYLGKNGEVNSLMKNISTVAPELKKEYGQHVNNLKNEIEELFESKITELKEVESREEELRNAVDVTIPSAKRVVGKENLNLKMVRELNELFTTLGCTVVEGPELELPWFNFDALNTPEWHPAREMQDTFYIDSDKKTLLRTHTSPVQIRTMLKQQPPMAIISPGRVYRKDEPDATHSPIFTQLECLYIDKIVNVGHLKMFLEIFAKRILGENSKVLLRPSYFPFVEPGFEVDATCVHCGGKGCNACKGTGWIELLGAGLVNPKVLQNVGYDPDEWQGFAFGMGVERVASLKYNIHGIRHLYRNDVRFIE